MILKHSHKAALLTLILISTIGLLIVNAKLINSTQPIKEAYHEIKTLDPQSPIENDQTKTNSTTSKTTNKAYNTTKTYKPYKNAYKQIKAPKTAIKAREASKQPSKHQSGKGQSKTDTKHLKTEELTTYKSINSILKNQENNGVAQTQKDERNTNSSVYYSLKNRTDTYLPIPVYLCDRGGKVVVTITVLNTGRVKSATINDKLSIKNECLRSSAKTYALKARFNSSDILSQTGTITYHFKD